VAPRRTTPRSDDWRLHYAPVANGKKGHKTWHDSQGYKTTRQRLASQERKLAAHRKSLHGKLVHEVVATGTTIITEMSQKALCF
jgi:hypothetical protein